MFIPILIPVTWGYIRGLTLTGAMGVGHVNFFAQYEKQKGFEFIPLVNRERLYDKY